MEQDHVLSAVINAFQDTLKQEGIDAKVRPDTHWLNFGLDSVALLGIFGELEELFGIEIDEELMVEQATIADLATELAMMGERA
ncbi:acyl carrier protein [Aurantivibrio plasticivorans]